MIGFAPVETVTASDMPFAAQWAAYRKFGDNAIDGLIEVYIPLTHRVLERISMRLPSHVEVDDLSQAALLGLYKAIVNYDPDRGVPFEGYAYPRIRGAIIDELRSNDNLSRGKRSRMDQVERVIAEWMREHSERPSEEVIASKLGITVRALNQLLDEAKPWCSLDASGVDDIPLHETIADPKEQSEQGAQRHDMQQLLREGFRSLDMREQKILYLYYFEELRLSEIAALFSLSEARISQIHALSVVRLRAALVDNFPAEFVA